MTTVATIAEAVRNAELTLEPHSESPRLDAELLLATLLGLPRSALIARSDEHVALHDRSAYAELVAKRAGGVPIAYLTGSR
jgi:release factor glutamine methyltransferase